MIPVGCAGLKKVETSRPCHSVSVLQFGRAECLSRVLTLREPKDWKLIELNRRILWTSYVDFACLFLVAWHSVQWQRWLRWRWHLYLHTHSTSHCSRPWNRISAQ
jgi:hypothetical protein